MPKALQMRRRRSRTTRCFRANAARATGTRQAIVQRPHRLDAAAIASELGGGATGLDVVLPGTLHPLGPNVGAGQARATIAALTGAIPDGFLLRVDAGSADLASAASFDATSLVELAVAKGCRLVFTFDPIAGIATGQAAPGGHAAVAETARLLDERGIAGAAATADGRIWHAGGATEEQELAAVLATYVAYLRVVADPTRFEIQLATDADQFRSIAKLRAMRLLAARVAETAGLEGAPRMHVESAWRMMSAIDPDTNILRTTAAAFAALVGGADSVTVLPHDCLTENSDSGRRLARNAQTILADEASLWRVDDPAAGSGALEALTGTLAEAAWRRFQKIEAAGGIVAAIAGDELLQEIAQAREARLQGARAGRLTMIGANAYRPAGSPTPEATSARTPIGRATALAFKRLSEAFEGGEP
jgi:methylmalonyl-CoA mutase